MGRPLATALRDLRSRIEWGPFAGSAGASRVWRRSVEAPWGDYAVSGSSAGGRR